MERIEDITAATETMDLPSRFQPAIISGLTYYLARKRKPEMSADKKIIFDEELKLAMDEDRERTPLRLVPAMRRI